VTISPLPYTVDREKALWLDLRVHPFEVATYHVLTGWRVQEVSNANLRK